VKDAYHATNQKDKYTQMTIWLERKEKILEHEHLIQWQLSKSTTHPSPPHEWVTLGLSIEQTIHTSQCPSARYMSLDELTTKYGATYFHEAFSCFVTLSHYPSMYLSCPTQMCYMGYQDANAKLLGMASYQVSINRSLYRIYKHD
jgi:hypothetical protein